MVLGLGIGLINNLQELLLGSEKIKKYLHIQIINPKKTFKAKNGMSVWWPCGPPVSVTYYGRIEQWISNNSYVPTSQRSHLHTHLSSLHWTSLVAVVWRCWCCWCCCGAVVPLICWDSKLQQQLQPQFGASNNPPSVVCVICGSYQWDLYWDY